MSSANKPQSQEKHTRKKTKPELVFMQSFPMSSTNNLTRQRKKKANQSKQTQ
jgi:hypothetical protein